MNLNPKSIAFGVFFSINFVINAQSKDIRIFVVDSVSRNPIADVTIIDFQNSSIFFTDVDGGVMLSDNHGQEFKFSHINYEEKVIKITDSTLKLAVELKLVSNVLDEIVLVNETTSVVDSLIKYNYKAPIDIPQKYIYRIQNLEHNKYVFLSNSLVDVTLDNLVLGKMNDFDDYVDYNSKSIEVRLFNTQKTKFLNQNKGASIRVDAHLIFSVSFLLKSILRKYNSLWRFDKPVCFIDDSLEKYCKVSFKSINQRKDISGEILYLYSTYKISEIRIKQIDSEVYKKRGFDFSNGFTFYSNIIDTIYMRTLFSRTHSYLVPQYSLMRAHYHTEIDIDSLIVLNGYMNFDVQRIQNNVIDTLTINKPVIINHEVDFIDYVNNSSDSTYLFDNFNIISE